MNNPFNLKDDSVSFSAEAIPTISTLSLNQQSFNQYQPKDDKKKSPLREKLSDFEEIKELGSGAYGKVYLVEKKKTKERFAIKKFKKQTEDAKFKKLTDDSKFERECEIMSKIDHPNIVKYHNHFSDSEGHYIVMEYLENGNLEQDLGNRKIYLCKDAAKIVCEIISAVYYLHNMDPPLIHRDLKTENILLDKDDKAKLVDFGEGNYLLEERKTSVGTKSLTSPEILKNLPQNEKVDIWGIGVILYELVTGQRFKSLKQYAIEDFNITWPEGIPSKAKKIIKKILKLNPQERPSLEEILEDPFFRDNLGDCSAYLVKPLSNSTASLVNSTSNSKVVSNKQVSIKPGGDAYSSSSHIEEPKGKRVVLKEEDTSDMKTRIDNLTESNKMMNTIIATMHQEEDISCDYQLNQNKRKDVDSLSLLKIDGLDLSSNDYDHLPNQFKDTDVYNVTNIVDNNVGICFNCRIEVEKFKVVKENEIAAARKQYEAEKEKAQAEVKRMEQQVEKIKGELDLEKRFNELKCEKYEKMQRDKDTEIENLKSQIKHLKLLQNHL